MSKINELKLMFQKMDEKRLGVVIQKESGSVLYQDFMDRTWRASVESGTDIAVGDAIIVVNDVVIGTTEIQTDPRVFEV